MAPSVYEMARDGFSGLNALTAGRLDFTKQQLSRELSLQDEARRRAAAIQDEERRLAAQALQAELSSKRYGELMSNLQNDRQEFNEKQRQKIQDHADQERQKAEADNRRKEIQKMGMSLGLSPGATEQEVLAAYAKNNNIDENAAIFQSNEKALKRFYSDLEKALNPGNEILVGLNAKAKKMADEANDAARVQGLPDANGKPTFHYPSNYRIKTSDDFVTGLLNIWKANRSSNSDVTRINNNIRMLEGTQQGILAKHGNFMKLSGELDKLGEDSPSAALAQEFTGVTEHSTGPSEPQTQQEMITNALAAMRGERSKVKAIEDNAAAEGAANGESASVFDAFTDQLSDPLAQMMVGQGDSVPSNSSAPHPFIDFTRRMAEGRDQPAPTSNPIQGLTGMIRDSSTPEGANRIRAAFGAPPLPGTAPAVTPTPGSQAASLGIRTPIPVNEVQALRDFAIRNGYSAQQIDAVEKAAVAGDPVAMTRARQLYNAMKSQPIQ